jgi:hypothetical protein
MGVMRGPLSWFDRIPESETRVRSPSSCCWLTSAALEALAAPIELRSADDELLATAATLDEALTEAKKIGAVRLVKRGRLLGETP